MCGKVSQVLGAASVLADAMEERITKLEGWLSEHESALAKSRRQTNDAQRSYKALLEALQRVFRKHARTNWFDTDDPFSLPPEWEAARVAIYDAIAADAASSSGSSGAG